MMVPAEILADVSIYWLLAEAMWPAVKQVSMRASAGRLLATYCFVPTTYYLLLTA
jgi:hypothetical protein